ncbi:hypothetical protein F4559_003350 [Saccharothrix violaceirubra]|uniref:Uncharacterized protein n=1 Tax=Saccharothrix violaceirubra TaxID=413306 RepID=A0A7W7T3U1_9PSEU|nr:hypothetical protein [Saccharothrix violaceirubra]
MPYPRYNRTPDFLAFHLEVCTIAEDLGERLTKVPP